MIAYIRDIVRLARGEKVNLTTRNPGLHKILVGLGWDVNNSDGNDFDLDVSVFLLSSEGKVTSDDDFIFYGNLKHASGSVRHMGDNVTGEGDGDDEQIFIDLSKIPVNIHRIDFTVTAYNAEERKQDFGQVSNAYIRVVDESHHEELARYDLAENFSGETALVVGELYRNPDEYRASLQRSSSVIGGRALRRKQSEWKFDAIGDGFKGGLRELCADYGVSGNVILEKSPRGDSRI